MLIEMLAAAVLAQAAPVVTTKAPSAGLARGTTPALAAIVVRGQLLYLYDQAAWHSTDTMLRDVKDPAAAGVRGWIVEPVEKALRVTYYGYTGTQPIPVYVADFKDGKAGGRLVPLAERRPLEAEQQRMIAARSNGEGLERCVPQPFNTVVMPAASGAPIDVYFLTPQTKAGVWPMGKHYRLQANADGTRSKPRAFSRTCLEIGGPMPKGAKPVALFVNNVVDPVPTEIHVFTALTSRVPLVVQTSTGRWLVDGRTIRPLPAKGK